jgi:Helix-turn-helix domain
MSASPNVGTHDADTIAARRKFKRQKDNLKHAILCDRTLIPMERLVGYHIADHLNVDSGDAWPSQEYLAGLTGCSLKTIERATRQLAGGRIDSGGRWFRREIDDKAYRYIPRFDQIRSGQPVDNTRHFVPNSPDILSGKNVAQSSSIEYPFKNKHPDRSSGQVYSLASFKKMGGRPKGTAPHSERDEFDRIATAAARANGDRVFVYARSEPGTLWALYDKREGKQSPPTRFHRIAGQWREGTDRRSLYPPGFKRDA